MLRAGDDRQDYLSYAATHPAHGGDAPGSGLRRGVSLVLLEVFEVARALGLAQFA